MGGLNQVPSGDGAVGLYLWPAINPPSYRKVFFVNGMQTTPEDHRLGAWFVSEVSESYVVGVYNLVGFSGYLYSRRRLPNADVPPGVKKALTALNEAVGFGEDLIQCALDWTQPGSLAIQKLYTIAADMSDSDRYVFIKNCFYTNQATRSLFLLLYDELQKAPKVFIVCHSQGNLITSNALNALSWVLGRGLPEVRVFALASPAPYWPGGINRKAYTNLQDPVTWLSLGTSQLGDSPINVAIGKGQPGQASVENPDIGIPLRPWTWMAAHKIFEYVYRRDFITDIRSALGLSGSLPSTLAQHTSPSAVPRKPQRYVVKTGDSLSHIAQRFYGNAGLANRIYDANRAVIGSNPNRLTPGQELALP